MITYLIQDGGLSRVSLENAATGGYPFIQAPNKATIHAAGVEGVEGDCMESTPLSKIKIGAERAFVAGDPVKFKGTPRKVVEFYGEKYLKVVITREVSVFVPIWANNCHYLKYVKKTPQ